MIASVQFFFFEKVVQTFYTRVFTEPKESYGQFTQLGVTFASGYIAGQSFTPTVHKTAHPARSKDTTHCSGDFIGAVPV